MPELPWHGDFVTVDRDGQVHWRFCAVCRQPLSDPASIATGLGPTCRRGMTADAIKRRRNNALAIDRMNWRRRAERLGAHHDADAEARRKVFEAAMARPILYPR